MNSIRDLLRALYAEHTGRYNIYAMIYIRDCTPDNRFTATSVGIVLRKLSTTPLKYVDHSRALVNIVRALAYPKYRKFDTMWDCAMAAAPSHTAVLLMERKMLLMNFTVKQSKRDRLDLELWYRDNHVMTVRVRDFGYFLSNIGYYRSKCQADSHE